MKKWYVATLIMKIKVEDNNEFIVHKNLYLINSNSDEEAYTKSLKLGKNNETSFHNSSNKLVLITFEGVNDLEEVIDSDIEDGCELRYDEYAYTSNEEILKLITPKEKLDVFINERFTGETDYGSKDIRDLALLKKNKLMGLF